MRVSPTLSFGLLALIAGAQFANATQRSRMLPLDFGRDTPCINNSGNQIGTRDGTHFGTHAGPLGALATSGGACHGLARWVAVSAQNIEYDCSPGTRPGNFDAFARQLRRAHFLWESGCRNRLRVEGYCNLRDVCERAVPQSRQLAVGLNFGGTVDRGLDNLLTTLRDLHSDSHASSRNMFRVVTLAMRELDRGRYPILYRFVRGDSQYGHMIVLYGYTSRTLEALPPSPETQQVILHYYDPDDPGTPRIQTATLYPQTQTGISRHGELVSDFLMPWEREGPARSRAECERLAAQWEIQDRARSRDWSPF